MPRQKTRLSALLGVYGASQLYVELQRHWIPGESDVRAPAHRDGPLRGLSVVATNEPFFPKKEDFEAHDALLALSSGTVVSESNRRMLNHRYTFKTRAEMQALFFDLPDALRASVEIAQRCAYRTRTRKPILPSFGEGDEVAELRGRPRRAWRGGSPSSGRPRASPPRPTGTVWPTS